MDFREIADMDVKAHIVVHGIVQGVGYRFFVQRTARRMLLTGWVRNLYSGEVEIEVEGPRGLVESFLKELRTGNPYATVTDLQVDWQKFTGQRSGFDIVP